MLDTLLFTTLTLSSLGIAAAVILFLVSKKFNVVEDPRIDQVEEALPATNCGGCGFAGCRNFAEATVKAENLDALHCPVGGNEVMKEVAAILGKEAVEKDPYVAVLRCAGSFEHRQKTNTYDGAASCAIAAQTYSGDTGCAFGCLGIGDCVDDCDFDAMYMDEKTGLPVINEDKCTACNGCVNTCPKDILTLVPKGRKDKRIFVACMNEEKGGVARQNCDIACTGCAKCSKECKYEAITVGHSLAMVDPEKCRLCGECVTVCETNVLFAANFSEAELDKATNRREKRKEKEKEKLRKEREKARAEKEKAKAEAQRAKEAATAEVGTATIEPPKNAE